MNNWINQTSKKWLYLLLFATSFLIYSNTLNHGFVLDDDIVFKDNQFVQEGVAAIDEILSHGFLYGFNGKNDQSYRPLTLINLAIEKQLFGNNPSAIHFMHLLLYALAIVLLFRLLTIAFQDQNRWIAFWISLLFALHPIHTEVVANIKSRDEILHFIFAVSLLTVVIKAHDTNDRRYIIWAFIFSALALLSKEMAVSLVLIIPLFLWTFRSIRLKRLAIYSLPFGTVLLLYFLARSFILDSFTFDEEMTVINNTLAAASTYSAQLATNFYIFSEYIKLLFFPHPLSWDYSYPYFEIVNFSNPRVVFTLLFFLVAFLWSIFQLKNKNILAFSILFFLSSFSLVSNFFILIGSTLGERLLFFPSIGFVVFLVFALKMLINSINISKKRRKELLQLFLLLVAFVYAIKTFNRNADWKSNKTLFQAGVKATPNNSRAHAALASAYRKEGERLKGISAKVAFENAIEHYQKSIDLYAANSDAWYNLGVTYMNMNSITQAKRCFEECISYQPNHVQALNNLGVIYFRKSNYQKALSLFSKCEEIDENFQKAQANLGAVHHNLGNFNEAKYHYEKALKIDPSDANTLNNYRQLTNQ